MTFFMAKVFRGFAKDNKKNIDNKRESISGPVLLFLAVVFLLVLVIESVQRESIGGTLAWLGKESLSFFLNYLLAVLISLFLLAVFGSYRWGLVVSAIIFIFFSLANSVKIQFLGEPIFPWDFTRLDQVVNLLPQIAGETVFILAVLGITVIGLIIAAKLLIPELKFRTSHRMAAALVALFLLALAAFYPFTPLKTSFPAGNGSQAGNYLNRGTLLSFFGNIEKMVIIPPQDYSQEEIQRIIRENEAVIPSDRQQVKPNIIIMLSESFWDPLVLPGLNFSQDPIPFFRELSGDSVKTLISPVYGGSTANVEFELLTGLSVNHLPEGLIAYQQYVHQPLPSLAWIFKQNGYGTTAIHPYHAWFYRRDEVYPLLGFDKFLSLDDFSGAEIKGEYIVDTEVSHKIIEQAENSEGPFFIFAVTMQNHGPYPEDRYDNTTIKISGEISDQGIKILETYTEGLTDSDLSFKILIDYFSESDKPTLIVFLGDHLPYLGKDYLVYKETGFVGKEDNKWSLEDELKMKAVPMAVWSNYPADYSGSDTVSPSFLGAYLLEMAGVQKNNILNFAGNMAQKLPVYHKTVSINKQGLKLRQLPPDLKKLENDYFLLQYDLLFGQQYCLELETSYNEQKGEEENARSSVGRR